MKSVKLLRLFVAGLALLAAPLSSYGENGSTDLGDYIIHYSAFSTDILTPQVAKTYGISRSKSRALLNITVLKKVMGTPGTPVTATISGSATNLTGQFRELTLRQVEEGHAIYYIGEFRVTDRETMDFTLDIKPEGEEKSRTITFRQKFYTS